MHTKTIHTLCDHSVTQVYEFEYQGEVIEFERCTSCGLNPILPALTASGPEELLPWWDYKPVAKRRIDAARPGINAVHERRDAAREQVMLLRELVEFEKELGEQSSLTEELAAAEEYRLSLCPSTARH